MSPIPTVVFRIAAASEVSFTPLICDAITPTTA
jgi:hypothetical protein